MNTHQLELTSDYEHVLQQAQIAAIVLDEHLRISSFTPEVSEIYGLIDSDIGRPLSQFMPLVGELPPLPVFEELRPGRPVEHVIRTRCGKTLLRRVWPVSTDPNEQAGIVVTFVDVTSLQVNQDELLESKRQLEQQARRLKTITDATPTMIAYVDTELRYKFVNQRYAKRFGKAPTDLIGTQVAENLGPEEFAEVQPRLQEALRGKQSTFELELQLPGTNDVIFKEVTYVPDFEDDTSVVGCHVFAIDVTERKRSALAEERLRLAAEAAGFGTYQIDLVTGRTHWSDEFKKLVGAANDADQKVRAAEVGDFVHVDDRRKVADRLLRAKRGQDGGVHAFTHRIVMPDGTLRWVRWQGQTIRSDSDGRPVKIIGTLLDISSQKQIEQSLEDARRVAEAANDSKSEFLANMSHEIRTPMSAIMGYTDILSRQLTDPDDIKCVSVIRHNGKFLLEIINDILDISKIEAGKLELHKKRFAPDQLVADVCSLMEIRATEKGIVLEVSFDGEIPQTIRSDDKRLKQILVNLIGNAIKFTKRGTVQLHVRFVPSDHGSQMQFVVIDTGIGMSRKQITNLFQPFTQGDSSVVRRFEGTGLGLSISQRLAGMLGGEITVESTADVGSKFTLTIDTGSLKNVPLVEPTLSPQPASPKSQLRRPMLSGRILVVDDRRDMIFLAQHLIEDAGGSVTSAENGRVAIKRIKEAEKAGEPFDLVTMDMQMPVLDGYEATRRLRKSGFSKPIVAVTAHAMQGDRQTCMDAGCTDYITKPLDGPKFLTMLAHHLRNAMPAETAPSACQVLVIDDAEDTCKSIKTLLGFSGYNVEVAYDGQSGIDQVTKLRPAVVLLDLSLPDMSGFEVIKKLKPLEATENTLFIAATGHENDAESAAAGFDHHLTKPLDLSLLESLIESHVSQQTKVAG
jgi:two-component system CheB/CheR fusion protein